MNDTSSGDRAAPIEKSGLLEQLRIDRSAAAAGPRRSRRRWPAWLAAAVIMVAIGWVAARLLIQRNAATTSTALASAAGTSSSANATSAVTDGSSSTLDASGYVVARREATVSAVIIGKLSEVLISEGTRVQQGQVIARLDDGPYRLALAQSRASLEGENARLRAAQIAYADAEPTYQRNEKQRAAGFISAQDFDAVKLTYDTARSNLDVEGHAVAVAQSALAIAERNLTDTVIRAPFSGIVTSKDAQPGEIVAPGSAGGGFTRTGIGTIVDMDSLEVEVDVSENFINRVQPGQLATVKLNAYPDWAIPAKVIAVIPTADRSKATVKVRIGFEQRDARILPEMGARVSFQAATP